MKQVIGLMMGCLMTSAVLAQPGLPVVKGYAWHQSTAGGAKPSAIAGENNTTKTNTLLTGKLFVFLEAKKAQNILPFRIWIDGKPYRVQNTPLPSTPFVKQYEDGGILKGDTLVPATRNAVMQVEVLSPITQVTIPPVEDVSKNARPGAIVVEYYWRAKRYAYTISEIKILEAVRLQ